MEGNLCERWCDADDDDDGVDDDDDDDDDDNYDDDADGDDNNLLALPSSPRLASRWDPVRSLRRAPLLLS